MLYTHFCPHITQVSETPGCIITVSSTFWSYFFYRKKAKTLIIFKGLYGRNKVPKILTYKQREKNRNPEWGFSLAHWATIHKKQEAGKTQQESNKKFQWPIYFLRVRYYKKHADFSSSFWYMEIWCMELKQSHHHFKKNNVS